MPELFGSAPGFLHPVLASPLTLATVLAVVINQVLRLKDLLRTRSDTGRPGTGSATGGSDAA